jgi:hypothetical protein
LLGDAKSSLGDAKSLLGDVLPQDVMSRHYQTLKGSMHRFRNAEGARLKQLTLNSGGCITDLQDKVKLGSRLLRLAELNRKMETEQEKVVPFFKPISEEAAQAEAEAAEKGEERAELVKEEPKARLHSFGTDELGKEPEEWEYFGGFHQRYNKVAARSRTEGAADETFQKGSSCTTRGAMICVSGREEAGGETPRHSYDALHPTLLTSWLHQRYNNA